MKKMILAVSVLVVAALALGTAAPALAAGPSQGGPEGNKPGGRGFARNEARQATTQGERMMVNQRILLSRNINLDGQLADIIHEELALALELSPAELSVRQDAGETLIDIALSLGMDEEAIEELFADVRLVALTEGTALGLITQEESDWLSSRGFGNPSFDLGLDCRVD